MNTYLTINKSNNYSNNQSSMSVVLRYNHLLNILNSYRCQRLICDELLPIVESMFTSDIELLQYTMKNIPKDSEFHNAFNKIFIDKEEYFPNIKNIHKKFTLVWLYCKYH